MPPGPLAASNISTPLLTWKSCWLTVFAHSMSAYHDSLKLCAGSFSGTFFRRNVGLCEHYTPATSHGFVEGVFVCCVALNDNDR